MKLLHLSAAFSAAVFSFVPCFHTSANAFEPDHLCFMVTQSGKVLNLSESHCGLKKSAPEVSANSGGAFSEDSHVPDQEALREEALRQEALRQEALRLINTSKQDVAAITDSYIPR